MEPGLRSEQVGFASPDPISRGSVLSKGRISEQEEAFANAGLPRRSQNSADLLKDQHQNAAGLPQHSPDVVLGNEDHRGGEVDLAKIKAEYDQQKASIAAADQPKEDDFGGDISSIVMTPYEEQPSL